MLLNFKTMSFNVTLKRLNHYKVAVIVKRILKHFTIRYSPLG